MVAIRELLLDDTLHLSQLKRKEVFIAIGQMKVAIISIRFDTDYLVGIEAIGFVHRMYQ